MPSKVLIFGAGGFAGKYLTDEFLHAGYEVVGSDRNTPSKDSKGTFVVADLLKQGVVENVVADVQPDVIVNLAAISSVGQSWRMPQATINVNVVGTLNVLEAARKLSNSPKVLLIGSSEEYAPSDDALSEESAIDGNNPYGISKATQERFAALYREEFNIPIYCVRAFNHTGIGQRDSFVLPSWCKQVAEIEHSGKSGIVKVGTIDIKRDFSDVRDIVHAYRLVLEQGDPNEIYNIGSGEAYSLREILTFITHLSNQEIDIAQDPSRVRPTDNPVIKCDHTKLTDAVNWQPTHTVFDALREMYSDYLRKL